MGKTQKTTVKKELNPLEKASQFQVNLDKVIIDIHRKGIKPYSIEFKQAILNAYSAIPDKVEIVNENTKKKSILTFSERTLAILQIIEALGNSTEAKKFIQETFFTANNNGKSLYTKDYMGLMPPTIINKLSFGTLSNKQEAIQHILNHNKSIHESIANISTKRELYIIWAGRFCKDKEELNALSSTLENDDLKKYLHLGFAIKQFHSAFPKIEMSINNPEFREVIAPYLPTATERALNIKTAAIGLSTGALYTVGARFLPKLTGAVGALLAAKTGLEEGRAIANQINSSELQNFGKTIEEQLLGVDKSEKGAATHLEFAMMAAFGMAGGVAAHKGLKAIDVAKIKSIDAELARTNISFDKIQELTKQRQRIFELSEKKENIIKQHQDPKKLGYEILKFEEGKTEKLHHQTWVIKLRKIEYKISQVKEKEGNLITRIEFWDLKNSANHFLEYRNGKLNNIEKRGNVGGVKITDAKEIENIERLVPPEISYKLANSNRGTNPAFIDFTKTSTYKVVEKNGKEQTAFSEGKLAWNEYTIQVGKKQFNIYQKYYAKPNKYAPQNIKDGDVVTEISFSSDYIKGVRYNVTFKNGVFEHGTTSAQYPNKVYTEPIKPGHYYGSIERQIPAEILQKMKQQGLSDFQSNPLKITNSAPIENKETPAIPKDYKPAPLSFHDYMNHYITKTRTLGKIQKELAKKDFTPEVWTQYNQIKATILELENNLKTTTTIEKQSEISAQINTEKTKLKEIEKQYIKPENRAALLKQKRQVENRFTKIFLPWKYIKPTSLETETPIKKPTITTEIEQTFFKKATSGKGVERTEDYTKVNGKEYQIYQEKKTGTNNTPNIETFLTFKQNNLLYKFKFEETGLKEIEITNPVTRQKIETVNDVSKLQHVVDQIPTVILSKLYGYTHAPENPTLVQSPWMRYPLNKKPEVTMLWDGFMNWFNKEQKPIPSKKIELEKPPISLEALKAQREKIRLEMNKKNVPQEKRNQLQKQLIFLNGKIGKQSRL